MENKPLSSWNEGPARQAIIDFVHRVTTAGSPDLVPVSDRIAVLDNDGTLWCEQPVIQLVHIMERLLSEVRPFLRLSTPRPREGGCGGVLSRLNRKPAIIPDLALRSHGPRHLKARSLQAGIQVLQSRRGPAQHDLQPLGL